MKVSNLKNMLCAVVVATLGLSACKSAEVTETVPSAVVIMEEDAIAAMLSEDANKASFQVKPGHAYMTKATSERVSVRTPFEYEFTQVGLNRTRINADTAELGFFEWGWNPKGAYEITYRLVWFDGQGNITSLENPQVRRVMPSDPVRFSSTALLESSKTVSVILDCKR